MRGLYNFPISGKGELKILCFCILPISLSLIFLLASGKVESYSLIQAILYTICIQLVGDGSSFYQ